MAIRVLGKEKPIIAMVHLTYEGNLEKLMRRALKDVEALDRGGVQALLFENWGGYYPNRAINQIALTMTRSRQITDLPFGVNILPIEYKLAFDIAGRVGAVFVQMDTFVDRLQDRRSRHVSIEVDPEAVEKLRERNELKGIKLFANVQSKHYITIPQTKPLELSATEAIAHGADALVVTGRVTGEETPKERILEVKRVAGEIPVLIGSGLNDENAPRLLPSADGAIVGTSLKVGGYVDNPVDEGRVRRLMEVVRTLRT